MSCQKCGNSRVARVFAHSRDCNDFEINGNEHNGYVPSDMGIGRSDDVSFSYCLECGQIQGTFPLPKCELEIASHDNEDYLD